MARRSSRASQRPVEFPRPGGTTRPVEFGEEERPKDEPGAPPRLPRGVLLAPGLGGGDALDYRTPLLATEFDVETAIFPPAARVRPSANIAIATSTHVTVTATLEHYDTDDIHSVTASTARLTAQTPGVYHIFGQIEFTSNANNDRQINILLNGASMIAKQHVLAAGSFATRIEVACDWQLGAGEYVEFRGWQNSGIELNMLAGAAETFFGMRWVASVP